MATAEKSRYRVLRPIWHGSIPLKKGNLLDLTDAEAGHLLATKAIEFVPPAVADEKVVDLGPAAVAAAAAIAAAAAEAAAATAAAAKAAAADAKAAAKAAASAAPEAAA